MSVFHHKTIFSQASQLLFMFQCNDHVEMNKFLCSLACIWMKIIANFILLTDYMANCLYLHDSYITKFDFMNYAFAKLVVEW